ncbi:MAG: hypothetical protein PHX78_01190 [bacterium]|nr:hypothetical protein [bacterium]
MGILFDLKKKIDDTININNMDKSKIKGLLVLKTGFSLAPIKEDTPDDPEKIEKLKKAIAEILHITNL